MMFCRFQVSTPVRLVPPPSTPPSPLPPSTPPTCNKATSPLHVQVRKHLSYDMLLVKRAYFFSNFRQFVNVSERALFYFSSG